jgi:hypothetical protein
MYTLPEHPVVITGPAQRVRIWINLHSSRQTGTMKPQVPNAVMKKGRMMNMHHNGYLHYDHIIPDQGYYHSDSSLFDLRMPTNHYMDDHFSAGAIYSDPKDLLLFDQALFHYKLLQKATTALMLKPDKALADAASGCGYTHVRSAIQIPFLQNGRAADTGIMPTGYTLLTRTSR